MDLIDTHFKNRKLIIATHHLGLFAILYDWLLKGEKSDTYKKVTKAVIMTSSDGELEIKSHREDVLLYHLYLLQILDEARSSELKAYHFALLRQVLENIASFLGVGRVGFVLERLGFEPERRVTEMVNFLSHKNVYGYEDKTVSEDNKTLFEEIYDRLMDKYNFILHTQEAAD